MTHPYDSWIGREATVISALDPWPAQALRAVLGLETATTPVTELPPLWSWLYFLDAAAREAIGSDGHERRGGFIPPISAPRRMFAGGRLEFLHPLRLGAPAQQTRKIVSIDHKAGSAGPLVLLTIGYDHGQAGASCVRETRDIVYLEPAPPRPDPASTPVPTARYSLDLTPDAVFLMRFSALTFNAHRIHYDLPYARDVEGYPERVVHGPLLALLLAELARLQAGLAVASFAFRARAPLFLGETLHIRGEPAADGLRLQAFAGSGRLVMTAEAA